MALQPLASGFAGVAGAYERGRPEYAPAVVEAIVRRPVLEELVHEVADPSRQAHALRRSAAQAKTEADGLADDIEQP